MCTTTSPWKTAQKAAMEDTCCKQRPSLQLSRKRTMQPGDVRVHRLLYTKTQPIAALSSLSPGPDPHESSWQPSSTAWNPHFTKTPPHSVARDWLSETQRNPTCNGARGFLSKSDTVRTNYSTHLPSPEMSSRSKCARPTSTPPAVRMSVTCPRTRNLQVGFSWKRDQYRT